MRELLATITKRSTLVFTALVLAFSTVTPIVAAQAANAAAGQFVTNVTCQDQKAVLNLTTRQALLDGVHANELNWNAWVQYTTPHGSTLQTLSYDDVDTFTIPVNTTEIAAGVTSAKVFGSYTTKEYNWLIGYYHQVHFYDKTFTANYDAKNCDSIAPTATITYSPAVLTNKSVTVTLTASEAIKQASLPGMWNKVSDTVYKKVYPVNTVQNVTLEDLAGNTSNVTVDINWIDKTLPTVTNFEQVYETKQDGRIAVTLTFSEPIVASTLGQGWSEVGNSNKTKFVKRYYASKSHTVTFRDNADNEGTYTFTVDMTAPAAPELALRAGTVDLIDGGLTNSYSVKALWNTPVGDPVKYEYKYWNDIASSPYNSEAKAWINPSYITGNESDGVFNQGEGTHYAQVRAFDAVGNPSNWSNAFEITYDATAPTVDIVSYSASANVITPVIEASDTNGPLTYSWSGSNANVTRSADDVLTPAFTVTADGTYSFELDVTDAAGNVTTKTFTFSYAAPIVPPAPFVQPASFVAGAQTAGPTNGFANVALNDGDDTATNESQVLGANTQDDEDKDVLAATTTPEIKDGAKVLGLDWYWWLPILVAGAGAAWWFIAFWRRRGEEA